MQPIEDPMNWNADVVRDEAAWRIETPAALADELVLAARRAVADGAPADAVDRRRFDCPGLADFAGRIHAALEDGMGFAVVAGLPTDRLDHAGQTALALGLSDRIGRVVPQNYELQRIVDVCDEGVEYSHRSRGYRGREPLPFHTDGAHLFSLTCLSAAAEGGETVIVSGVAAYNRLLAEAPEALPILERGFYHHRRGQHDPGEPPLSSERVPVFQVKDGLLHCCYNRNPIEWAEKEGVTLTGEERAALDALDAVLARRDMQLRLNLAAGESMFINNFATLHSRTAYVDGPGRKRHMLRHSASTTGAFPRWPAGCDIPTQPLELLALIRPRRDTGVQRESGNLADPGIEGLVTGRQPLAA